MTPVVAGRSAICGAGRAGVVGAGRGAAGAAVVRLPGLAPGPNLEEDRPPHVAEKPGGFGSGARANVRRWSVRPGLTRRAGLAGCLQEARHAAAPNCSSVQKSNPRAAKTDYADPVNAPDARALPHQRKAACTRFTGMVQRWVAGRQCWLDCWNCWILHARTGCTICSLSFPLSGLVNSPKQLLGRSVGCAARPMHRCACNTACVWLAQHKVRQKARHFLAVRCWM
jgi:hypothetical protein